MLEENIKKLRKRLNLSQEDLATRAGITYSTLTKVENGSNSNPTLATVKKIADAFNIPIDDLVGRVPGKNNDKRQ